MSHSLSTRLALDATAAVLIVTEFGYSLTGDIAHEIIGFVLALALGVHLAWNGRWFLSLRQGRYGAYRRVSVGLNLLLLLAALLTVVSGLLNSRILAAWFHVESDLIAREYHTAAGYWFLILMALHLGLHGKMIMSQIRGRIGGGHPSALQTALWRVLALAIAVLGVVASFERELWSRLTAYYSFDFQAGDESVIVFFAQYLAIVGLYACLAFHALALFNRRHAVRSWRPGPCRRCARLPSPGRD